MILLNTSNAYIFFLFFNLGFLRMIGSLNLMEGTPNDDVMESLVSGFFLKVEHADTGS